MLVWLMNMGFAGGGTVEPTPDTTPPAVIGGVKRRRPVFRLADMESREELERFIKSHVAIKTSPVEEKPQTVYVGGARTESQIADERMAELAMRNMQIEAENEIRIEYNNQIILLLIAAALDE